MLTVVTSQNLDSLYGLNGGWMVYFVIFLLKREFFWIVHSEAGRFCIYGSFKALSQTFYILEIFHFCLDEESTGTSVWSCRCEHRMLDHSGSKSDDNSKRIRSRSTVLVEMHAFTSKPNTTNTLGPPKLIKPRKTFQRQCFYTWTILDAV